MATKHLIAIVRSQRLEAVETALREAGADGVTVSRVKGFGEQKQFFSLSGDWHVEHVRLEIFASEAEVPKLVDAVMDAAHTGGEGDGLVAVSPVERLTRIRSRNDVPRESGAGGELPVTSGRGAGSGVRTAIGSILTIIAALAIVAAFFVTARHQMHFLVGLLIVVLALCILVGLPIYGRQSRR